MALITDLPTNASPSTSDYMITDNGSTTSKSTIANVKTSMGLDSSTTITSFSIASSSSKSFTIGNASRIIIFANAPGSGNKGAYILSTTGGGTVGLDTVHAASNVSFTVGTGTITVANAATQSLLVSFFVMQGSVTG